MDRMSPFWTLEVFRQHFWLHFALDFLHVSLEGNWLRHFRYLGIKYGASFCQSE